MTIQKQIDFTKSNQAVYFTGDKLNYFHENCTLITGKEPEDIKTMSEFIELVVNVAMGNTEHLERVANKLNSENAELKKQAEQLREKYERLSLENSILKADAERLPELQNNIQKQAETLNDAIILQLSPMQNSILRKYANDKKTIEFVNTKFNQKGRFDGLYDRLNTGDEKTDIQNLLKCVTFANIRNGNMPNTLIKAKDMETEFLKQKAQSR